MLSLLQSLIQPVFPWVLQRPRRSAIAALFCWVLLLIIGAGFTVPALSSPAAPQRWAEVLRVVGNVQHLDGANRQPAQPGLKLRRIGEGLATGPRSSTVLRLDVTIGNLNVAENTQFRILELGVTSGGGHRTQLQVTQGQIRIQIRRFTNPQSTLELVTPAGISGVRGTEFGITVQQTGKTGIATRSGSVIVEAQNRAVNVSQGLQVTLIPGEPPPDPEPLRDDPRLDLHILGLTSDKLSIRGQTDRANLLHISDEEIPLDSQGQFEWAIARPPSGTIEALVTTPLGRTQKYKIVI
jgi:hypothetical protein